MSRHRVFPLTLEEVLDDSSFDLPNFYPNHEGYDDQSYPLLWAPPSTPTDDLDRDREHDQGRWRSFSSEESNPTSMVDDCSGTSDSDAKPPMDDCSPETPTSSWDHDERLWGASREEVSIVYRRPCRPHAAEPSNVSSALPTVRREHLKPTPSAFPGGGKLTPIVDEKPLNLHRSRAQRNARRVPNLSKSLPSPPKRGVPQRQRSTSKHPRSPPDWNRLPTRREHPFYVNSPYQIRPSINPCNSSQPFSFNNTPPLPYLAQAEKSVFECDSDDELYPKSATRSSSTLAAKLHFRSVSLGSKRTGFPGSKDSGKQGQDGRGRRRSATDFVRGIFGIRKN